MHAVVLGEFGGPGVLRPQSAPDPVDSSGHVTVELRASALNWHDVLVRQGRYGSPLPHIIGADGAGVRRDNGEEVVILPSLGWGENESAPGPGWQILGDHQAGTYAELVSVPVECVRPKPSGLSWEQAAALPLVGVTVYRALFARGRLAAGESLLVLGAGGGVATMSVQLGVAVGARVVVTSSMPEKISGARDLGASDGVLYTDPDWPAVARTMSPGGAGFDVVLDSVGAWSDSVQALRPGGRLVVLGASRGETATLDVRHYFFGQYDLLGTTMGSPRDFDGLLAMINSGSIAPPPISRVFPLDQAAAAHEFLEQGSGFGKVILTQV